MADSCSTENLVKDVVHSIVAEKFVALESRLTALENQLSQLGSVRCQLYNDDADPRAKVQTEVDIDEVDIDNLTKVPASEVPLPTTSAIKDGNALVLSLPTKATHVTPSSLSHFKKRSTKSLLSVNEYEAEASIYGLLALPSSHLHYGACILVAVFYALTAGLTYIIYDSMVGDMVQVREELYVPGGKTIPLCTQIFNSDKYTWECIPDSLARLMDFAALDLDGNGIWTMVEARESKLLSPFRSLLEVALEQDHLLASMFPPTEPVLDPFCTIALRIAGGNANVLIHLSASEQVAMFETSGRVTPDLLHQCHIPIEPNGNISDPDKNVSDWNVTTGPLAQMQYLCLLDKVCGDILLTPGNSTESQFYEATSHMSYVPRFLYEVLSQKMLRPCRLLDPTLCGNADVQDHTLLKDVWPDLSTEQALKECSYWVSDMCPRILGEDFTAAQARMSAACGEQKYNVVKKKNEYMSPSTSVLHSGAADLQCQDPADGAKQQLTSLIHEIFEQLPIMRYMSWAEEAAFGVPRGTIEKELDCNIAGFLFGDNNFNIIHPVTNQRMMISDGVGDICPMTVCERFPDHVVPMGCPVRCLHTADQAYQVKDPFRKSLTIGEYTQVSRCSGFQSEVDAITGALRISRLMDISEGIVEHCEMVLWLNKSARVYVTTWNIPMREETTAIAGSCIGDHLAINGVKYCTTQRPAPVDLEPTPDGYTVLVWTTCRTCGPFNYGSEGYQKWLPSGFELLIVEMEVPSEHLVVMADFEMHRWYWNIRNGVTRPLFRVFMFFVMLVWIGYMGDECFQCIRYIKFIMQELQNSVLRQVGLIIFLVIPRICVWLFVLYTGFLLLATANSYIDLVLNSVALAFVLDFDEYLFLMSVPPSLKEEVLGHGVIKLDKWTIERWHDTFTKHKIHGYNMSILLRMLGFVVAAIIVVLGLYKSDWIGSPHFDKVADIYDCLCALRGDHCPAF